MGASTLWSCGVLGKVHGLHGELYLSPASEGVEWLELGERFFVGPPANSSSAEPSPCRVERVGGTDQRPLLRLDLATTREQAIALQGRELFASGEALAARPHYRVGDLIGLRAETADGVDLGVVADVAQTPAHELVVLKTADGKELLVPLVDELVEVDLEAGLLRVVAGLLDDLLTDRDEH